MLRPLCCTGKYRKYSYSSLRDLLRVIRNKHSHFRCAPGCFCLYLCSLQRCFYSRPAGACSG